MDLKAVEISPIRKIAVVKWPNRPYVLVKYIDKPGLLYGVIRLSDVEIPENCKVQENQIYNVRLENEFKYRALIIHQSTYSSCQEGFSITYNRYRKRYGL